MSEILEDLREQVAKRRAVLVVGAGVSIGASAGAKVASWAGLLEHGVRRCLEVAADLPSKWAETRQWQVQSGDLDEMVSAAEQIVVRLGGAESGEFRRWLRETVGALSLKDREVLEALRDLELPLATTNYDGLLEAVTNRPAVTWREPERALRVLRGEEPGILHLHGFWQEPASVVLGIRSYGEVLASVPAQTLQQVLGLLHSLVFVGFGGGLADPNFGSLLAWLRRHWSGAEHRHFRLCLARERESLRPAHQGDRIFPVPYGDDRPALPGFLRGLAAGPKPVRDPGGASLSSTEAPDLTGLRLRAWPEAPLPSRPYPLLLPYEHPALFAGRAREQAKLAQLLETPIPILGLFAVSGAGKSSLLSGGLVPALRADAWPVALDRHPAEPGLPGRLLGELFEGEALAALDLARVEREPRLFVELLLEARRLAGRLPVLIVDQFEDLFRGSDGERARRTVGLLLAASARRLPGEPGPLCRWLLACRRDFHGEVAAWLPDVLLEARAAGLAGVEALPHDLSGQERFHAWDLPPFGAPPPGARPAEAMEHARQAFREAIERPLALTAPSSGPAFPWRFAEGEAERLSEAFAEARLARREAPLVPQLQVVLARLLEDADPAPPGGPPARLSVPEDPGPLIESALEDHLRRALDRAFPAERTSSNREARARALLALRELADDHGRKGEGLAAAALARAIGSEGDRILEALAAPESRILVPLPTTEGIFYVLSHDRMAQVVIRQVDEEARRGLLEADPQVLELRRFVSLQAQLFAGGDAEPANRVTPKRFRAIARRAEALLWDEERRSWWQACVAQRKAKQRRALGSGTVVLVAVALLALAGQSLISRRLVRSALLTDVEGAAPGTALESVWRLVRDHDVRSDVLSSRLTKRKRLEELFEEGPGSVQPERGRSQAVLAAVGALLPLVNDDRLDTDTVAAMTWALDYFPAREGESQENLRQVRELRTAIEQALRAKHGAPPAELFRWVEVRGGEFRMGSADGEGEDDERPLHPVRVSPFSMLAYEVTNGQLRRVFPDHEGSDDLTAVDVSWYQAYVFAAWAGEGGRLPTEAEWEYAARAGCPHPYCDRNGEATTLDEVGWHFGNSGRTIHEVGKKQPNRWGLYDLHGNAWEWVADWYGPYPAAGEVQQDPWGPPLGGSRVLRGGSAWVGPFRARAAYRDFRVPWVGYEYAGFRVVLPAVPEP